MSSWKVTNSPVVVTGIPALDPLRINEAQKSAGFAKEPVEATTSRIKELQRVQSREWMDVGDQTPCTIPLTFLRSILDATKAPGPLLS